MSTNPNTPVADEDAWYHGSIDKEEAVELLTANGKEGTFLVRESTSREGDYALSVIYEGEVIHFQICRHDGDAFFSVATALEKHVIHGLDELIKFYQSPDNGYILLGRPLIHSMPPPECRRHGRTNLLHRATKEGQVQIVRDMVRCGHRNIDAKNEEGQTAGHIAAIQGHTDILKILIEAGTNVNAKDLRSHTPLHYACIHNHPDVVRVLLSSEKCNPQLRRHSDGWVALHEASSRDHVECVKILLENKAPMRPRTDDGKFPIQLAEENSCAKTVHYLKSFRPERAVANRDDWYHSLLDRQEAVSILQQCQSHNNEFSKCYFLVRRSSRSTAKTYVLTLLFQARSSHYEISQDGNYFYIDNGPYLESLEEIVDHYSRWADGLPSSLQVPVNPTQSFPNHQHTPVSSPITGLLIPPPLPKRTPLPSPNGLRLNSLPNILESLRISPVPLNNSFGISSSQSTSLISFNGFSKDNIPSENIEIGAFLGTGEYRDVYEGNFTAMEGSIIRVAVKTVKDEITEYSKQELLRESQILMELEHDHIVKFIGLSWHPKICIVEELMALGSLRDYLVNHVYDVDPLVNIPLWAYQVTKGMMYLEFKEIVHRDLAVRNILLSDVNTAKISDFGLSRVLGDGKDYYTAAHGGKWPIKWYAPECCSYGTFSHKSDVWSFGITLWEMYSYGDTPYGVGVPGSEVIEMVENGTRLSQPEDCPEDAYQIMKKCWNKYPDDRPSFTELNEFFLAKIKLETVC